MRASSLCFALLLVAGCGSSVDDSANAAAAGAGDGGGSVTPATTSSAGGGDAGGGDAGGDATGGAQPLAYPAPHPGMPVIPNNGGVVLHDPAIVTVTFAGDANADFVEGFGRDVGSLAWWGAVTSEYGIGPATSAGDVRIADALPATMYDEDVQAWIEARITDGTLPAPTDQTVYALYMPSSTTVSFTQQQGGGSSCREFLGYHNTYKSTATGATIPVAYAITNECTSRTDDLTETASHELAEVATDPHPVIPGLGYMILNDSPWTTAGGEVADMCSQVGGVSEGGYMLTRSWSNANAKVGNQPCQPTPDDPTGTPYFNAALEHDTISLVPGASTTMTVSCYSFGPLPNDITLQAQPYSHGIVTITFDKSTCSNGDVVTMTIAMAANASPHTQYHYDVYSNISADIGHIWRGMIDTP